MVSVHGAGIRCLLDNSFGEILYRRCRIVHLLFDLRDDVVDCLTKYFEVLPPLLVNPDPRLQR